MPARLQKAIDKNLADLTDRVKKLNGMVKKGDYHPSTASSLMTLVGGNAEILSAVFDKLADDAD